MNKLGFVTVNIVVIALLSLTAIANYSRMMAPPTPALGDWTDIVGRKLNNKSYNIIPSPTGKENFTFLQLVGIFLDSGKYPLLRFQYSELTLKSDVVGTFTIGSVTVKYTEKGAQSISQRSFKTVTGNYVYIAQSSMISPETDEYYAYGSVGGTYVHYPALVVNSTVLPFLEFDYKEVWTYRPIISYDYSNIEIGRAYFNGAVTVIVAVVICDILILIANPKSKREVE